MKRALLPSKAFIRSAKRLAKRDPSPAADVEAVLDLLHEDAFHPALRTHKLKGKLSKSWACSAGYDLRVVSSLYNMMTKKRSSWRQQEHTTRYIDVSIPEPATLLT